MHQLSVWLNDSRIQYCSGEHDRTSAIECAAAPLFAQQAIERSYIDAIIRGMEETGPYFVIAPGIAMPHARPEKGAKALGLSVVLYEQGVIFNSAENDPVRIVFMFSAPDSNSHIEMISALAELLSDDEEMEKVLSCTSQQQLKTRLIGD